MFKKWKYDCYHRKAMIWFSLKSFSLFENEIIVTVTWDSSRLFISFYLNGLSRIIFYKTKQNPYS